MRHIKIKALFSIAAVVLIWNISFTKEKVSTLTQKEKAEDFKFLYKELKASYPYFGMNKRQNNVDWLANKRSYLQKIKSTKTDKEYVDAVNGILNDLNNGHTDAYPTIIYNYFYDGYKGALEGYPYLQPYVEELEKTNVEKCAYWAGLMAGDTDSEQGEVAEAQTKEESKLAEEQADNIQIQYDKESSVAMIGISSFSYDLIEEDTEKLADFFTEAHTYKNLIIDIRGNSGGDDRYWQDHIIAHLIDHEIEYPVIFGFKKSRRLLRFKPDYQSNSKIKDIGLTNCPEDLVKERFTIYIDSISLSPKSGSKPYMANVYLLADQLVYSSTDSFAYFCKATGFAKILGERTGGGGIGSDPLLLTLPNSGIVIRFAGEMALNPDGSSNEEMKTVPDYKTERLKSLDDITDIYQEIKTAVAKG